MTAEEIRNIVGEYPPESIGDFALIEIAAQLAQLNETMTRIAENLGAIKVLIRSSR